jgi:hypothetical protein
MLRLINGGGVIGEKNEGIMEQLKELAWFHPLIDELKTIRGNVSKLNPELMKKAIKAKGDKYYNLEGTTLSYLLTNLENQVLNVMINGAIKKKIKLSSTIYDGYMPYKDTVPDLEEYMRYLESEILKFSGYTLQISQKIMDEGIVIPDDYVDPETREEQEKEADKLRTEAEKEAEKRRKEAEKEQEKARKEAEKVRREREKEQEREEKKSLKEYLKSQKELHLNAQEEKENEQYFEIKERFEETHFKLIETSNFIIETESGNNIFKKKDQLITSYEHFRYGENKSFIRAWLCDPTIRHYKRCETIPHGVFCPDDTYNLWTPFPIFEPYEHKEDTVGCEFFVNHIKSLLPDERVHDYFFKWMSHLIQFPKHKNGVRTPFLISEQGAGKDSIVQLLRAMMGTNHILETSKPSKEVWGDFNDLMTGNTYLVVLNELSRAETIGCEEHIKMLQTEETMNINPKGNTPYTVKSYHRFLGLTNKEDPLGTSKGDRRNLFFRCSDDLIGNSEHFEKFYDYLNKKDTIYTFYNWLVNYKYEEVRFFHTLKTKDLPILEYQEEMTELNIDHFDMFIKWMMNDTQYINREKDPDTKLITPSTFSSTSLLQAFTQFKEQYGLRYEVNAISLGVKLSRKKIDGIEKKKTKVGNVTVFDYEKLKEKYEKEEEKEEEK